jgi:hypothetical protein
VRDGLRQELSREKGELVTLILLGFGKLNKKDIGILGEYYCPSCHTTGLWRLIRLRAWAIILLLPVLPLRGRYWAICERCRSGYRLSAEHGKLLAPWARLNRRYHDGFVDADDYSVFVRSIQSLMPVNDTSVGSTPPGLLPPRHRLAKADIYVNPS